MAVAQLEGTPLAAVFVLVAIVAVLAAALRSGASQVTFDERYRPRRTGWNVPPPEKPPPGVQWVDRNVAVTGLVAFGLLGTLLGAAVGSRQPSRLRAVPLGAVVGLAVGGAGGFLMVCPPRVELIVCGSVVILVTALVIRLASDNVG